MCGIAGLYRAPHAALRNRDHLARMLARIGHRGPDGLGLYFDDVLAFGTARLSIIDIAGGDQPIGDESGRHWVAFNGEIYNYKELRRDLIELGHGFQTSSDTEVLLKAWMAWGEGALSRLNGPFAAALYDRATGRLVLCRDRFGKRPLHYWHRGGTLAFGSEIKCFLDYEPVELVFDTERMASIFRTWAPLDDQSCFRGVDQVPAGAMVIASGEPLEIRSYAPLDLDAEPLAVGEAEAIELTRATLERSVRLRLRSDVEVGTFLSGGLDSSIVTSLTAANVSGRLKTFSVAFEDDKFDESDDQALVARHLATDHHTIRLSGSDIAAAFPDALWHAEVPVFRSAFVPMFLLSRTARREGIKVVLTGEGADEAFLGYDIFKETLLRSSWHELDVAGRRARLAGLYPYLDHFSPDNLDALYGYFDRLGAGAPDDLFSHELRFRGSRLATRLLRDPGDGLAALRGRAGEARLGAMSVIQRAQWLEFKTLLSGYLLSTQGDRMALAHGVENRCPFLDPEVVRWGASTNLKYDDGYTEKYLLKQAFTPHLPPRSINRHKQPYLAPDASAFLTSNPDYLDLVLSDGELKKIDILDGDFCKRLVGKIMSGPLEAVSQAENQAFMFLLSTAVLHDRFLQSPVPTPKAPALVREIDGRGLS
jgi:asparagine synthase (glutamine-hydrolysing)